MDTIVPGSMVHVPSSVEQFVPTRVEHVEAFSGCRVPCRVEHVPCSLVQLFHARRSMFLATRYDCLFAFFIFFSNSCPVAAPVEVCFGLSEDREVLEASGQPLRGLRVQPRLHIGSCGVSWVMRL